MGQEDLLAVYTLIDDLYELSSFQQVESLTEALIASYDEQHLLYGYLAYAKYKLNKFDDAMTTAKKSLIIKPYYDSALELIDKINAKKKS